MNRYSNLRILLAIHKFVIHLSLPHFFISPTALFKFGEWIN